MARGQYRILALDVDGTLLDSGGALRPRTAEAVARAARAGIRPVLCTGRRYRRARPIAALLALNAPIVCNSGAIVKDPRNDRTLWRLDSNPLLQGELLELFVANDQPVVASTDRASREPDFIVPGFPTGKPLFDEYVARNREHAELDPDWTTNLREPDGQALRHPLFHVCAVGSRPEMVAFQQVVLDHLSGRVQTFVQRSPRYSGTMCEVLRHDASKWTAVLYLARLWGVGPSEICAVGDDVNDVPMIRNAGLGVAMGHAPEDVLAAADHITGDHHEEGVAMLVDEVLLAG